MNCPGCIEYVRDEERWGALEACPKQAHFINLTARLCFSSCGDTTIIFPMLLMTACLVLPAYYAVVRVSGRVKRNADVLAPYCRLFWFFHEEEMGRWSPTFFIPSLLAFVRTRLHTNNTIAFPQLSTFASAQIGHAFVAWCAARQLKR